jgi:formamidopyrimidine-DNA glycosylase
MPELPEVEITARLIGAAVAGVEIESALSPGINALKTFDPPLSALEGRRFQRVGRRGKLFLIELDGDLALEIHLMSAGRLQLFDTRASLRDRTSRFLVRLKDGRELRLREFGTRQRAWVKVLRAGDLAAGRRSRSSAPRLGPIPRHSPSCSTSRVRCTRCFGIST